MLSVSLSKEKTEFNVVKTEAEHDVSAIINGELEKKIQEVINECSAKYFRNIEVEFHAKIK